MPDFRVSLTGWLGGSYGSNPWITVLSKGLKVAALGCGLTMDSCIWAVSEMSRCCPSEVANMRLGNVANCCSCLLMVGTDSDSWSSLLLAVVVIVGNGSNINAGLAGNGFGNSSWASLANGGGFANSSKLKLGCLLDDGMTDCCARCCDVFDSSS